MCPGKTCKMTGYAVAIALRLSEVEVLRKSGFKPQYITEWEFC